MAGENQCETGRGGRARETTAPGNGRRPAAGQWLAYGDSMRVLGVLAVVMVHVCDMLMFSRPTGGQTWWVANLVDAAGRWAVPVFIMLSGALLLNPSREQTAGQFYRRRLARLGVAVVFWSAFFMLFSVYYTKWVNISWSAPQNIWKSLLMGQPYMHLHFVFRLAGLYMITPMLRVYVRHAPWKLRAGMMLAILGVSMANSIATCFLGTQPSGFIFFWPFLAFYLAGDVLREVTVSRRGLAWSIAGFAVSWAVMAFGTGLLIPPGQAMRAYPAMDVVLYDFLNPSRVLMSFCAWFILAYVFGRMSLETPAQRVFKYLAPLTLGIYLVHPMFREILWKHDRLFDRPNVWLGIPATSLVIAVASIALVWILSRIPLVRRIVG